jgi:hypothetical protein
MTSPSSAQRAAPTRGSTKPRLYTPPLPENCDPERGDACACGCGLHPDSSWGFEVIAFLEGVLNWVLLPNQKWLYIHALEKDEGGGFRFETLIILIARQNGKTQWLKGLGLWKLYLDGAEQVLLTAQNLDLAETTLSEAAADVKANLLLRKEYRRFSQTNGKFKLVLKSINEVRRAAGQKPLPTREANTPREWRTTPATRRGGRSLSVDLAMLDELREHQNWKAWDAITPTTQSRERSLTVGASNAGDATSIVLRSLRDGALAKIQAGDTASTQIGLFEWSVPADVDYTDPQYWPQANPGLGYLPGNTIRRLQGKLEAKKDDPGGFKTEYLCMWVDTLSPSVFPADDWKATTDKTSKRAAGAEVWTSVDVNFERTKAYISVSAGREDGRRHIETIAAARGTDWVLPWYLDTTRLVEDPYGPIEVDGKNYRSKFAGIVIQERGAPATNLIEELERAGFTVTVLGGPNLTTAYSDFYDKLVEHQIMHRPSPALDQAAGLAQPKTIGDAWVIDRKKGDASAVIGCVQAEWAASRPLEEEQLSAYQTADLAFL